MPVIARFYGIIIKMYFLAGEHNPPHFHAIYGEYVGVIDLNRLDMIEGVYPVRHYFLFKSGLENTGRPCKKCGILSSLSSFPLSFK